MLCGRGRVWLDHPLCLPRLEMLVGLVLHPTFPPPVLQFLKPLWSSHAWACRELEVGHDGMVTPMPKQTMCWVETPHALDTYGIGKRRERVPGRRGPPKNEHGHAVLKRRAWDLWGWREEECHSVDPTSLHLGDDLEACHVEIPCQDGGPLMRNKIPHIVKEDPKVIATTRNSFAGMR